MLKLKLEYYWIALSVTTIGVLMAGIDTRIVIIGISKGRRAAKCRRRASDMDNTILCFSKHSYASSYR